MNQTRHIVILTFLLLALSSCGMAIKTAVDTARGGISDTLFIEPVQNLHTYNSIEVIPFTSAIGAQISPELLAELNEKIAADLSENGVTQIKGGELNVSGSVLHLLDDTLNKQIIVQVKFHDSATDQSVGIINISGQANSIRGLTSGMDAVAASISETLADHHFANMGKTAQLQKSSQ